MRETADRGWRCFRSSTGWGAAGTDISASQAPHALLPPASRGFCEISLAWASFFSDLYDFQNDGNMQT